MPVRTAEAEWKGTVTEGNGTLKLGSGAFEGAYSYRSRMEEGAGTNPEELLGRRTPDVFLWLYPRSFRVHRLRQPVFIQPLRCGLIRLKAGFQLPGLI